MGEVGELSEAGIEAAADELQRRFGSRGDWNRKVADVAIAAYLTVSVPAETQEDERVNERDAALVKAWTDHEAQETITRLRVRVEQAEAERDRVKRDYDSVVAHKRQAEARLSEAERHRIRWMEAARDRLSERDVAERLLAEVRRERDEAREQTAREIAEWLRQEAARAGAMRADAAGVVIQSLVARILREFVGSQTTNERGANG